MVDSDANDRWLSELELPTIFAMMKDHGATEILYKILPRNANSKNQVYLASDMAELGKIPSGEVTVHQSTSRKKGRVDGVFRAPIELYWLTRTGRAALAPDAKLIFYPQFPEVRFSGFLKGCQDAPSSLYVKERRGEEPDRVLFFGVGNGRKIFGITVPPEAPAATQVRKHRPREPYGAMFIVPLQIAAASDSYLELMRTLCRIHQREWVVSTRLNRRGVLVPCNASNCNGNTLEALLGIRSNGFSQPDFLGWEVKARGVSNSERPGTSVITLFTPEPTSGFYVTDGVEAFVRRYGYPDTKGRAGRFNFGGQYLSGRSAHARTSLRLVMEGFDPIKRIYSSTGAIRMLDENDREAMAWSFVKLMDHWKTKHARAVFVPSQQNASQERRYRFGSKVILGIGAEFGLLLDAFAGGLVYYDPGIKLESDSSGRSTTKRRSQFRVSSKNLSALYLESRVVDVCAEACL